MTVPDYDAVIVGAGFSGIGTSLEFRSLDQCGACELWGVCDVIGVSA